METNPYAPPQAKVADPKPASHGLKHRSVLLMLVLFIVTLGVYYPLWWFRRRPGLNRLSSPTKLAIWPPLLLAIQFGIQFVIGFVEGVDPEQPAIGENGQLFISLFQIAVGILMIVQAFKVKSIIEDHASPEESGPMFVDHVQLSGLMTFFFSIFYLQWAINRYVAGAPEPNLSLTSS